MKPLVSLIPEPDRSVDARKAIPRGWKDAALMRSGRQCARLDCAVTTGLEFDHMLALGLGGKHAADNIEPLCGPHHLIKTKRDVKMIARAKRLAGETCTKPGKPIPQRVNPWSGGQKLQSGGFGGGPSKKALRLIARGDDPIADEDGLAGYGAEGEVNQKDPGQ